MDILNKRDRLKILGYINSEENNDRKAISLKQSEIFNDRLFQYVKEDLLRHFSIETVEEMPVVSFINFLRRIVKQEASIYKGEPKRKFYENGNEMNEEKVEQLTKLYKKIKANVKLKKSNQKYKLQDQTHIMVVPVQGKLTIRSLYSHQIDAIPNAQDPEIADGYIISAFDKERYIDYQKQQNATGNTLRSQSGVQAGANVPMPIADKEDYKKALSYYIYWSKEYNFIFNGKGDIIDPATRRVIESPTIEDVQSPIPGIIPIIDISSDKDFEYFVRPGLATTDFATQYNAAMSDVWHISRMQGYSVGVFKGPDGLIPQHMRLGPSLLMHLKTNPEAGISASDVDFQFVSASPDIASTLQLLETMLMNFMASRGLDPKEMASEGAKSFNSALERMLAMIEEFEASKDDFDLYVDIESQLFEVVKSWLINAPDQIDETIQLNETAMMKVEFHEPQMVLTKQEKIVYWESKVDAGFASRIDAIMDIDGCSREDAILKIRDMDVGQVEQVEG
jgi:hypothetical protein